MVQKILDPLYRLQHWLHIQAVPSENNVQIGEKMVNFSSLILIPPHIEISAKIPLTNHPISFQQKSENV